MPFTETGRCLDCTMLGNHTEGKLRPFEVMLECGSCNKNGKVAGDFIHAKVEAKFLGNVGEEIKRPEPAKPYVW